MKVERIEGKKLYSASANWREYKIETWLLWSITLESIQKYNVYMLRNTFKFY